MRLWRALRSLTSESAFALGMRVGNQRFAELLFGSADNTLSDAEAIRRHWGIDYFERSSRELLAELPLQDDAAKVLREVGLPVGPERALRLRLRFESVQIHHQPRNLRRLVDTDLERGPRFPETGDSTIDRWGDLTGFVVIGEVPNDREATSSHYLTRFVCVDDLRGNVWWVYPKLLKHTTNCNLINTSLSRYLACLLACKKFREDWASLLKDYPQADGTWMWMDAEYSLRAETIHEAFRQRLLRIDPVGFYWGFWAFHTWNEAILMGIG